MLWPSDLTRARTIALLALQGDAITSRPLDDTQIAVPLLAHFALTWFEAARTGQGRRVGLRALGDAGVHCGGQQR